MKKVLIIASVFVASLTSCKSDYECTGTIWEEDGKEVLGECLDCSSSDAEDAEAAYKLLGITDASCEKK